jgi:thiol-disulfide isomerase/thioredoxin
VLLDSRLVVVDSRLAAEYALAPWLAIGAAVPYRMVDVDVAHRDPGTGAELPPTTSIHARTQTLRGVGDLSLTAHVARELGAYRLHARLGTSLPAGDTEEDPIVLGRIGQEHQHVQFGTGTFVPFVAAEVQRAVGPVAAAAWGLAHVSLYENDKGFRAGHRLSGGLSVSTSALARSWTFGLAAEVHGETAERWHGVVDEDEGNAGRLDVLAGASAAWRPMRGLAVTADVKLPVHSHVVGSQLDYGVVAGIGLAATFDLRRRPSWRGADHGALGPAGSAAALSPVPGRITVFDLWAAWCAPCRELDERLAALARAHPDRLAVRRLDVVDPDSAAWRRHLAPGGFELPHVKVHGADGALLFERTAPPAELARAIEELLRR